MSGTIWGIAAIVAAVVVGTAITVMVIRRRRRGVLVSIVLLRRTVRNLTEAEVRGAARRALGGEMDVKEILRSTSRCGATWFCSGEKPASS